jgi:hypothetical protein
MMLKIETRKVESQERFEDMLKVRLCNSGDGKKKIIIKVE